VGYRGKRLSGIERKEVEWDLEDSKEVDSDIEGKKGRVGYSG
jgi:hypothetical protein